jgi:hypothetical protein
MANSERTRKFDFFNENIMFDIDLTFAAFPTPSLHIISYLKKNIRTYKIL